MAGSQWLGSACGLATAAVLSACCSVPTRCDSETIHVQEYYRTGIGYTINDTQFIRPDHMIYKIYTSMIWDDHSELEDNTRYHSTFH